MILINKFITHTTTFEPYDSVEMSIKYTARNQILVSGGRCSLKNKIRDVRVHGMCHGIKIKFNPYDEIDIRTDFVFDSITTLAEILIRASLDECECCAFTKICHYKWIKNYIRFLYVYKETLAQREILNQNGSAASL